MRVLLRELSPGQQYAIQFRSNDGAGNTSDWSQVQRFTTTNDTIHPANVDPSGLTWYNTGTSYIAQWYPVTKNEDNTDIHDLKDYHVAITNGQTTIDFYTRNTSYEFTQQQCVQQFGAWQTALSVTVTARDLTYNESKVPATKAVNPQNPPTPSAPGVSAYLGLLMATWNSQTAGGADMTVACTNFSYCEVHMFTTANQPIPADNSSLVGRVFADGSSSKFVIPNLIYGQIYYIKLVAVNRLGKKSGPSAEASGTPGQISGLDIKNGQIAAEQINWTSTNIPGGNAYYMGTPPAQTDAIHGTFQTSDIWYNTANAYTASRWNGTTWVLATDVGFIPAQKLIAGTITADRIATNFFEAAKAYLGGAYIDQAYITSVNAASIKTGSLASDGSIMAGPANAQHAEMNATGFYVMAPTSDTANLPQPTMIPAIKMGTGAGDTFSITDPNNPDSTLASISSAGIGSLSDLYVGADPTIMGKHLLGAPAVGNTSWFPDDPGVMGYVADRAYKPVYAGSTTISGLNPSGSAGIRGEYGIAQYRVPVVSGRSYLINMRMPSFYINATATTNAGEVRIRVRDQQDTRAIADQVAAPYVGSATQATTSSRINYFRYVNSINTGAWQDPLETFVFFADYTGYANFLVTLELAWPSGSDSVVKIPDQQISSFYVFDLGLAPYSSSGMMSNGGASLYAYTPPPPPPPPTTQNYLWSGGANWVRSYQGNGVWMSNGNGNAYQGQDPSGYNGNQYSHFGFNTDFTSMLSGATNVTIHVVLNYNFWYYNSGGTAVIGTHNNRTDPGTANASGGWYNRMQSSGWPKPGSREIDITGWLSGFQDGGYRGIALGPGPSSSYTYYGYANSCTLKIWYTK